MARYFVAPPDDPNGNAGKTIGTDDRGSFWVAAPGEGASTSSGGNVTANPDDISAWAGLANNAAMMAYNNARLALDREQGIMRNEREKERIALEAARDAWNKSYQTSQLGGYMPSAVAGKGQAVMDAMGQLRTNAQYAAADGATRRQMEAATVAQATGIDPAAAQQAIDRLRQLTATTGQPSSAALVEQVLGQTSQAPTLARETEQNRTTVDTLRLLAGLRGPENAFAYASTIANLPESIRGNIQAAMGKLPFGAQNPAQQGVLGDVGVGAGQWQQGMGAMTGPRTAQQEAMRYLPAPQAALPAGVTGQPALAAGAPQGAAQPGYWSDASRGNPQPGMSYAQVITPAAYGPRTTPAQQAGLQPSNQWSPTEMLRTPDYAKRLMLSGYEWAGEDPEHTLDMYKRSLPTAVGPRSGTYRAA